MSIISNEIDPITLEPLENCKRKFSFVYKNVKTRYDFDNYYENIKKIGEIKPHSGEKLTLTDKICFNKICKYFNEPIVFPEAEREREKRTLWRNEVIVCQNPMNRRYLERNCPSLLRKT